MCFQGRFILERNCFKIKCGVWITVGSMENYGTISKGFLFLGWFFCHWPIFRGPASPSQCPKA